MQSNTVKFSNGQAHFCTAYNGLSTLDLSGLTAYPSDFENKALADSVKADVESVVNSLAGIETLINNTLISLCEVDPAFAVEYSNYMTENVKNGLIYSENSLDIVSNYINEKMKKYEGTNLEQLSYSEQQEYLALVIVGKNLEGTVIGLEIQKDQEVILELENAYLNNPNGTDYIDILKKYGYDNILEETNKQGYNNLSVSDKFVYENSNPLKDNYQKIMDILSMGALNKEENRSNNRIDVSKLNIDFIDLQLNNGKISNSKLSELNENRKKFEKDMGIWLSSLSIINGLKNECMGTGTNEKTFMNGGTGTGNNGFKSMNGDSKNPMGNNNKNTNKKDSEESFENDLYLKDYLYEYYDKMIKETEVSDTEFLDSSSRYIMDKMHNRTVYCEKVIAESIQKNQNLSAKLVGQDIPTLGDEPTSKEVEYVIGLLEDNKTLTESQKKLLMASESLHNSDKEYYNALYGYLNSKYNILTEDLPSYQKEYFDAQKEDIIKASIDSYLQAGESASSTDNSGSNETGETTKEVLTASGKQNAMKAGVDLAFEMCKKDMSNIGTLFQLIGQTKVYKYQAEESYKHAKEEKNNNLPELNVQIKGLKETLSPYYQLREDVDNKELAKEEYDNMAWYDKTINNTATFVLSAAEGIVSVGEDIVDGAIMLGSGLVLYTTPVGMILKITGYDDEYKQKVEDVISYDAAGAMYDGMVNVFNLNEHSAYGAYHMAGNVLGSMAGYIALSLLPGGAFVAGASGALAAAGDASQQAFEAGASYEQAFISSAVAGAIGAISGTGIDVLQEAKNISILAKALGGAGIAMTEPIVNSVTQYLVYAKDSVDEEGNKKYENFWDYYVESGGVKNTLMAAGIGAAGASAEEVMKALAPTASEAKKGVKVMDDVSKDISSGFKNTIDDIYNSNFVRKLEDINANIYSKYDKVLGTNAGNVYSEKILSKRYALSKQKMADYLSGKINLSADEINKLQKEIVDTGLLLADTSSKLAIDEFDSDFKKMQQKMKDIESGKITITDSELIEFQNKFNEYESVSKLETEHKLIETEIKDHMSGKKVLSDAELESKTRMAYDLKTEIDLAKIDITNNKVSGVDLSTAKSGGKIDPADSSSKTAPAPGMTDPAKQIDEFDSDFKKMQRKMKDIENGKITLSDSELIEFQNKFNEYESVSKLETEHKLIETEIKDHMSGKKVLSDAELESKTRMAYDLKTKIDLAKIDITNNKVSGVDLSTAKSGGKIDPADSSSKTAPAPGMTAHVKQNVNISETKTEYNSLKQKLDDMKSGTVTATTAEINEVETMIRKMEKSTPYKEMLIVEEYNRMHGTSYENIKELTKADPDAARQLTYDQYRWSVWQDKVNWETNKAFDDFVNAEAKELYELVNGHGSWDLANQTTKRAAIDNYKKANASALEINYKKLKDKYLNESTRIADDTISKIEEMVSNGTIKGYTAEEVIRMIQDNVPQTTYLSDECIEEWYKSFALDSEGKLKGDFLVDGKINKKLDVEVVVFQNGDLGGNNFAKFGGNVGAQDGMYVMPKYEADKVLKECTDPVTGNIDTAKLTERLGGVKLGDNVLVITKTVKLEDISLPKGDLSSAYLGDWVPGGKTSGGLTEGIISQSKYTDIPEGNFEVGYKDVTNPSNLTYDDYVNYINNNNNYKSILKEHTDIQQQLDDISSGKITATAKEVDELKLKMKKLEKTAGWKEHLIVEEYNKTYKTNYGSFEELKNIDPVTVKEMTYDQYRWSVWQDKVNWETNKAFDDFVTGEAKELYELVNGHGSWDLANQTTKRTAIDNYKKANESALEINYKKLNDKYLNESTRIADDTISKIEEMVSNGTIKGYTADEVIRMIQDNVPQTTYLSDKCIEEWYKSFALDSNGKLKGNFLVDGKINKKLDVEVVVFQNGDLGGNNFAKFGGNVGAQDGMYVMPKYEADKVLKECTDPVTGNIDTAKLTERLGGVKLGDNVLVITKTVKLEDISLPKGDLSSAYLGDWVPGGKTSGGLTEGIISQSKYTDIPEGNFEVRYKDVTNPSNLTYDNYTNYINSDNNYKSILKEHTDIQQQLDDISSGKITATAKEVDELKTKMKNLEKTASWKEHLIVEEYNKTYKTNYGSFEELKNVDPVTVKEISLRNFGSEIPQDTTFVKNIDSSSCSVKRPDGSTFGLKVKDQLTLSNGTSLYVYEYVSDTGTKILYSEQNLNTLLAKSDFDTQEHILNDFLSESRISRYLLNENGYIGYYNLADSRKYATLGIGGEIINETANDFHNYLSTYKDLSVRSSFGVNQHATAISLSSNNGIKENLISYLETQGLSKRTAVKFMNSLDNTGACSYASVCNEIFVAYRDNPIAFYDDFGFSMYLLNPDGTYSLNTTQLLADLYLNVNKVENGGRLFATTSNDEVIIFETNPFGVMDTSQQLYMSQDTYRNNALINRYLHSKNPNLTYKSDTLVSTLEKNYRATPDNLLVISDEIINSYKSDIVLAMKEGKQISLDFWDNVNSPDKIRMIAKDGTVYTDTKSWGSANGTEGAGSGHSVYVTAVMDDGLWCSSWGKELFIRWDDLKSMPFNIYTTELSGIGTSKFDLVSSASKVDKFDSPKAIDLGTSINTTSITPSATLGNKYVDDFRLKTSSMTDIEKNKYIKSLTPEERGRIVPDLTDSERASYMPLLIEDLKRFAPQYNLDPDIIVKFYETHDFRGLVDYVDSKGLFSYDTTEFSKIGLWSGGDDFAEQLYQSGVMINRHIPGGEFFGKNGCMLSMTHPKYMPDGSSDIFSSEFWGYMSQRYIEKSMILNCDGTLEYYSAGYLGNIFLNYELKNVMFTNPDVQSIVIKQAKKIDGKFDFDNTVDIEIQLKDANGRPIYSPTKDGLLNFIADYNAQLKLKGLDEFEFDMNKNEFFFNASEKYNYENLSKDAINLYMNGMGVDEGYIGRSKAFADYYSRSYESKYEGKFSGHGDTSGDRIYRGSYANLEEICKSRGITVEEFIKITQTKLDPYSPEFEVSWDIRKELTKDVMDSNGYVKSGTKMAKIINPEDWDKNPNGFYSDGNDLKMGGSLALARDCDGFNSHELIDHAGLIYKDSPYAGIGGARKDHVILVEYEAARNSNIHNRASAAYDISFGEKIDYRKVNGKSEGFSSSPYTNKEYFEMLNNEERLKRISEITGVKKDDISIDNPDWSNNEFNPDTTSGFTMNQKSPAGDMLGIPELFSTYQPALSAKVWDIDANGKKILVGYTDEEGIITRLDKGIPEEEVSKFFEKTLSK